MAEIIDNEEFDKDTVEQDVIDQLFNIKYELLTETTVSLKKSYITKLDGTKSLNLAVNQSDHSIEVYLLNNTSLSRICRLSGHKKTLTGLVFSPKEDHVLYSSGEDGVVKLWDTRANGSCMQEYKDEEEASLLLRPYECMDVSHNGRVLCAGSQLVEDDAYLVFFDQRMTRPLGGYWNSHTDDITQVKFHKDKQEVLVSGSLDGLLNVYNILEQCEDDALTYSLNVENSVETISWLDHERVACVTQSNDLQLWDVAAGDLLRGYDRDKVARALKRSKGDDCYLVDTFSGPGGAPTLLAGSHGGDGHVVRTVSAGGRRLQPVGQLARNSQLVRCSWYHEHRNVLVTAGERGAVSVWAGPPAT